MMMTLGMFVFSLPTLAYQELQRHTEWKHPSNAIVGGRDTSQYTGKGDDIITLSGWIAPKHTGSLYSLDALRLMADTGKAWILIQGTGRIYGMFVITAMTEGKTYLSKKGDPDRVEFSVTLKRVDQSVPGMIGGMAGGLAGGLVGKLAGGLAGALTTKLAGGIAGGLASAVGGGLAGKLAGVAAGGLASKLGDLGSIKNMLKMDGLTKKANDLMGKGSDILINAGKSAIGGSFGGRSNQANQEE